HLVFDKKGKVIEANFKTSVEGTYLVGNEKLFLPIGAEVRFSENNAKVLLPQSTQLKPDTVQTFDKNAGETTFEFKTPGNRFLFSNDNFFEGGVLKYKDGKYYFDYQGEVKLNHVRVKNDYDGHKVYVDFKGEINQNYNGGYVSLDKNKGVFVTGSNVNVRGPKVTFTKDNPYGLRYQNDHDHFAVQSLGNSKGAYVKIQNRNAQDKIPKMNTLNQFVVNFDSRSIHYHSGNEKLYYLKNAHIKDFGVGKSSVPIEISSFKNKNGKFESISKHGNVLGIGDFVEFGYGSNPNFIRTFAGYGKSYGSLKKGFSNSWLYYNIRNVNDLKRFLGNRVAINDLSGTLNNPGRLKWVTDILAGLPKNVFNSLRYVEFGSNLGSGIAGMTSPGKIQISSMDPATIRHEIAHNYHFTGPYDGKFQAEWQSVAIAPRSQLIRDLGGGRVQYLPGDQGFAWGYGSQSWMEDVATYGDLIYTPSRWTKFVSNSHPYHKIYRGKLAVLRKYGFITQGEYSSIFRTANSATGSSLDYSTSSLNQYIREAQQSRRG
ncbi:hypothetical protein HN451_11325, partial [archaeon]|nr:hypothetical protein [archaeon]